MNIFRSRKVWHDPNAAEVVKISEGQLFLVRTETVRGGRECIYNDAMATIRRVPSMEHTFQLVITRVYEDGNEELLEDEEETDEERVFLICEELEFRTGTTSDNEPTFVWRDLQGDVDELYEFVANGTNEPTRAFFETCMYRAMYERKYRRSADNTQDSDLQEFIWQPPAAKKPKTKGSRKATGSQSESAPAEIVATGSSSPQQSPKGKKAVPREPEPEMPSLFAGPGELFLWDKEHAQFEKQADVVARVAQHPTGGPYDYWLVASADEGQLLAHRVSSDMNQRLAPRVLSFTWNYIDESGAANSWCLRFDTQDVFEEFQRAFSQALWEGLNQLPWGKAKYEDQAYVMSSINEDVEMKDAEDEEDEEDAVAEELDKSDDDEEEDYPEDDDDVPAMPKGRNKQLTVGYKGDRSYVVRDDKIGVFSHTGQNQVKYYASISNVSTPQGKVFSPKHVMLHDQDTKMILMNPNQPHSLYNLDIERGKVVEEWKVHDDITVDHIAPDNKYAQMTPEQTVVGISHNALFRIDPRVSGTKMVDSQYKQYVSKNKFSGVATTESGKLAVASEKGEIRLFDSIGKNAKTALPPLGDPIIGIDVTADGRWIVATTKTYLLLIDTLIGEGRYTGQLGFDRSFPATAKPIPRRLQLRAEHVAYMGHSVSFTPARFNMGEGKDENAIVTSTGEYVVAWDFAKVKKGQLDKYEIKKYDQFVVQDSFKFGDDKEIIVALQNDVLAINKKNLKRPTRASLAPGAGRTRSSIVNSPY
ncbi:VID27 cytoplasmic protein [Dichomitus squalens LYAD-421 SS1]|uniref:VID27 cytoplasmic protein n=1 Tax=Dichomitus squalens (strain LYAD-421) TaxID=732165 RepID=R7SZ70_DICSQ|nr:VID27 cytoplasmic protein [Dichomitus squalens LYAD-421 SS1]EJF61218.1 VID27 cytoplasmic protein [Dichomitus squalens LYAD-421 SS1]